jgi:biopolymer transport protein ExbB
MVDTFHAVAARSSETTEMVAGGISRALITTQAGLVAALPGTFGLAHLSRLLRRLRGDLDVFEYQLDRILEKSSPASAVPEEAKP